MRTKLYVGGGVVVLLLITLVGCAASNAGAPEDSSQGVAPARHPAQVSKADESGPAIEQPKPPTPTPPKSLPAQPVDKRIAVTAAMRAALPAVVDRTVRASLLAPTTATIHPPELIYAAMEPDRPTHCTLWAIGRYDAQNAFGAMIRNKYTVICWWDDAAKTVTGGDGMMLETFPGAMAIEHKTRLLGVMYQPEPKASPEH